jgi:hypothetical protein
MIEPVLPAGTAQPVAAKAERPPVPIVLLTLPAGIVGSGQARELKGTILHAAADGTALLRTAAGDVGFKAPMLLAAGKTATLFLTPTPAGPAASLRYHGPAQPLPAVAPPMPAPGIGATAAPPPGGNPPLPTAGPRDATMPVAQLAAQVIESLVAPAFEAERRAPLSAGAEASGAPPPHSDGRAVAASSPALAAAVATALRTRPPVQENDDLARTEPRAPGEAADARRTFVAADSERPPAVAQFAVRDDGKIVPVYIEYSRHRQDEPREQGDPAETGEPTARFAVAFDLDRAGAVRMVCAYRQRRLDVLLELQTAPDREMQQAIGERLAGLSNEFGLAISLRVAAPAGG